MSQQQPLKRRASAAYSVPRPPDTRDDYRNYPVTQPVKKRSFFLLYVGIGMLLALLGYGVVSFIIIPWWNNLNDQWHYGDVRISTLDGDVGHGGDSKFLGFVYKQELVIVEVTGTQAQVYSNIAMVSGSGKPPVLLLSFSDINHDGKPDIVVRVEGQDTSFVLVNTGSSFHLATP